MLANKFLNNREISFLENNRSEGGMLRRTSSSPHGQRLPLFGQIYARSEIGESPPTYCTVFHHMVKSAGSTVKSILRRASVVDGVAKPGEQAHTTITSMQTRRFVRIAMHARSLVRVRKPCINNLDADCFLSMRTLFTAMMMIDAKQTIWGWSVDAQ